MLGGSPVYKGSWPRWPEWRQTWEPSILQVLRSGQWYRGSGGEQVPRFEAALLKHFRDEYPEILDELRQKGELPDELAERVRKVVSDFKTHWK